MTAAGRVGTDRNGREVTPPASQTCPGREPRLCPALPNQGAGSACSCSPVRRFRLELLPFGVHHPRFLFLVAGLFGKAPVHRLTSPILRKLSYFSPTARRIMLLRTDRSRQPLVFPKNYWTLRDSIQFLRWEHVHPLTGPATDSDCMFLLSDGGCQDYRVFCGKVKVAKSVKAFQPRSSMTQRPAAPERLRRYRLLAGILQPPGAGSGGTARIRSRGRHNPHFARAGWWKLLPTL